MVIVFIVVFVGFLVVGEIIYCVDSWCGSVVYIYGYGNVKWWGWIYVDFGDGDVLEVVIVVLYKLGLCRFVLLVFVCFCIDGKDWFVSFLLLL